MVVAAAEELHLSTKAGLVKPALTLAHLMYRPSKVTTGANRDGPTFHMTVVAAAAAVLPDMPVALQEVVGRLALADTVAVVDIAADIVAVVGIVRGIVVEDIVVVDIVVVDIAVVGTVVVGTVVVAVVAVDVAAALATARHWGHSGCTAGIAADTTCRLYVCTESQIE